MSLREFRRQVGRLAIVGFDGYTVPTELQRLAAAFDLGGVIYFARNIQEPAQVRELSRGAAALAREWPLWISVDQEGGRVARFRAPFTEWPPALTIGRSGDETLARRMGAAVAAELRAVGITLDYAPVLDVHTNPANPIIGDRAFAERPEDAARLGAAFIRGMQDEGIAACGKHFPGHGDTSVDSHLGLPVLDHDRRRLEAVEWVPFRAAVAAGVAMIMTAHLFVPAVDEAHIATFSRAFLTSALKQDLGFGGVVVSDDLGMSAVSATMALGEAAVRAVAAGCDAVLLCNSTPDEQATAIEALIRAAENGTLTPSRIADAFRRQHDVKARFRPSDGAAARGPSPSLGVLGCSAHQAIAAEMARWS